MNAPTEPKQYRLSIRRPVTIAMVFLTLLVFGWKSYQELSINLMPDIAYPTLTVRTEYDGAAPEDVEKLVTRPLEERLSVVSGVEEISSVSSAGLSEVIMEFAWGSDMNVAMQGVRDSLDQINLPQGVTQNPVILRFDPTLDPVLRIALIGRDLSDIADPEERLQQELDDLTEIREAAERQLKSDLEAEPGIAQVVVKGGREDEIQINLDSARLKSLGLTPEMIVIGLQQQNVNLSGGLLKEGKAEYLVRTLNEFASVEEIRNVIISTPAGDTFRLSDIARVEMGIKERKTIVTVNGQEAVELEFFKEGSANVVQVANRLKRFFKLEEEMSVQEKFLTYMAPKDKSGRAQMALDELIKQKERRDQLKNRLPDYTRRILITDQSRFIESSINEVKQTALIGGALALCILFVFLREIRSTVIIGVAIPISVVATFVPMFIQNISLNIMSLGGLALGVGMLVDNSIVVLESIFRCREEGDSVKDAAERGTKEVATAVTASTLTTIAVFFPIVFVEGIAGQLFRDLALTVTFSLMASLMVALYLIPMIASREGMHFKEGNSAVWILRGLREAKDAGKTGIRRWTALPRLGLGYALVGLGHIWGDTAGLALKTRAEKSGMIKSGFALVILVTLVLFILRLALALVATIISTVLVLILLGVMSIYFVVSRVLRVVLFLPLQLFEHAFQAVRSAYALALRQALHVSPIILAGVAVLVYFTVQESAKLGQELIPPMKQGEFGVRIEAKPGTRLEDTEGKARNIEEIISAFPEVESVTVQVGGEAGVGTTDEGENVATLTVKLADPERTVAYQDEIIEAMRQEVMSRTSEQVTFTLPTLFSFKTALELQIYGEDLDRLREVSETVLAMIHDVEGLKDTELSLKQGYPEIHVILDRELLSTKNIQPFQVAQLLRTEVQGDIATQFNRGGEKVDIRVRSDQERFSSLADLRALSVVDGNPPVPLASVSQIIETDGPSEIRRIDQRQVVVISANVEGRDLGSVAKEINERLSEMNWSEGYSYVLGGQNRELEKSYGGLMFAIAMAIFLVYVVMACQFESVLHPMFIMFSVPLAAIGVVYTLKWTNGSVSIIVFIGGIVLAGIVVNSAIVLVDYINQLRARGLSKVDAIVEAGTVRFRPIMMTTATTVLGLIPMVLSSGEGSEIRSPMAVTIMSGLIFSTVLTLFIIPVIYYMFTPRDAT
ncbi:MAG: efflux RND transporter permease subunit [Candidatus Hydrogenedentota bacterium]